MTKLGSLVAVLPLCLAVFGCPADDGTGEADTSSETGPSSTETETETGGSSCTPPGVFADCGAAGEAACMTEGGPASCVLDVQTMPNIAVCGRPCADACDCWAAPATGDATVACASLVTGDDGTCVLDCSGDLSCPDAMVCNEVVPGSGMKICVFPQ